MITRSVLVMHVREYVSHGASVLEMKGVPLGALVGRWRPLSTQRLDVDVDHGLWHPRRLAELSAGVLGEPVLREEDRAGLDSQECHRGAPPLVRRGTQKRSW